MPGTVATPDIELIIEEKKGGGRGGGAPPSGGGDGGGNDGQHRRPRKSSPSRYYTGIALGIVSILMFFMALASAFLVRKGSSAGWVPVRIPALMWFNTAVLLTSSGTLEIARKRLGKSDLGAFRAFWLLTTALGVVFVVGQAAAWRVLAAEGIYLATNPASSFLYIFTGAHALHLIGGIVALLYVAARNFDRAPITRAVSAEVTSYYWHFMDALWIFLFILLYLGK